MGRRIPLKIKMLNKTATSVSAGVRVSDYRNCVLSVIGSPGANLKVYFKGAVANPNDANLDSGPDFTVLSSARNEASDWEFVQVIDLMDGSTINGTTGMSLSGNRVRLVEVNINSLDWLAVHATAVVAGTVTIVGSFTTNE